MKALNHLLVFLLIISTRSNADPVAFVEKDTPAPFSGFLFTPDQAKEMRVKLLERDYYFEVSESLEKTVTNYNTIVDGEREKNKMLLEQNTKLIKDYQSMKDTSDLQKILWFSIGVAATVLGLYGLKQTLR